jgi:ubiquitin C-terminal hydrolase
MHSAKPSAAKDSSEYHLYGYISHQGAQLSRGHYFSVVKAQCSAPHRKGTWKKCDDGKINTIGDREEKQARNHAYIFFYQLRVKDNPEIARMTNQEFDLQLSTCIGEELEED